MPREKLSEKEKKDRQEFLANETPVDRTTRVLEPVITKTFKQLVRLGKAVKSPRYILDDEQKQKISDELDKQLETIKHNMWNDGKKEDIEFKL